MRRILTGPKIDWKFNNSGITYAHRLRFDDITRVGEDGKKFTVSRPKSHQIKISSKHEKEELARIELTLGEKIEAVVLRTPNPTGLLNIIPTKSELNDFVTEHFDHSSHFYGGGDLPIDSYNFPGYKFILGSEEPLLTVRQSIKAINPLIGYPQLVKETWDYLKTGEDLVLVAFVSLTGMHIWGPFVIPVTVPLKSTYTINDEGAFTRELTPDQQEKLKESRLPLPCLINGQDYPTLLQQTLDLIPKQQIT